MLNNSNIDQSVSAASIWMNNLVLQNLLRSTQFQHQQLLKKPNSLEVQVQQQQQMNNIQIRDSSPPPTVPQSNVNSESNLFQQQINPQIQTPQSIPTQPSPFYPISILNNLPISLAETEKKFSSDSLLAVAPKLDQIQKATKTSLFELFPQKGNPQLQFSSDSCSNYNNNQYLFNLAQFQQPILGMNPSLNSINGHIQNPPNLLASREAAVSLQSGQIFPVLIRNSDQSQFDPFKLLHGTPSLPLFFPDIKLPFSKQQQPQSTTNGLLDSKCLQEEDSENEEEEDSLIIKDEHISINENDSSQSSSFDSEEVKEQNNKGQAQIMGQICSKLMSRLPNGLQQKTSQELQNGMQSQINSNGKQKYPATNSSPLSRPRAKNISVSTTIDIEETKDQSKYISHLRNQFREICQNSFPSFLPQKKLFPSIQEGFTRIRQANSQDLMNQNIILPNGFMSGFTDNLLQLTDSIQENSLIRQNPHLIFGYLLKPIPEQPLDSTPKQYNSSISLSGFRKTSDDQLFGLQLPLPSLNLTSFMSIPRFPSFADGSLNNEGLNTPFSLKNSLRRVQSDGEQLLQATFVQKQGQQQQALVDFISNNVKINDTRPRGVSFQSLPSTNNGFSPTRHPSSRVSILSTQTPVLNPAGAVGDERTLLNLYSKLNNKDVDRSRQFGTAKNTSSNRLRQRAESLPIDLENNLVQESVSSPVQKRSKYHNLTKLFMYFLLSLFSIDNMDKLKIPKFIQEELIKCVQNVKKTAKKKIKNHNLQKTDFFNHTHYNVLFLHLNKKSLKELQKKEKDIDVHKQCFSIDLKEINEQRLEYVNILKKFAYEIVINTLECPAENDCQNNPRNEYMLKALSGIRQLAQGNAIFRFQQIYTGSGSNNEPLK